MPPVPCHPATHNANRHKTNRHRQTGTRQTGTRHAGMHCARGLLASCGLPELNNALVLATAHHPGKEASRRMHARSRRTHARSRRTPCRDNGAGFKPGQSNHPAQRRRRPALRLQPLRCAAAQPRSRARIETCGQVPDIALRSAGPGVFSAPRTSRRSTGSRFTGARSTGAPPPLTAAHGAGALGGAGGADTACCALVRREGGKEGKHIRRGHTADPPSWAPVTG